MMLEIQHYTLLLSDLANGVTGEIHYVDAGYNKVGMPDPKNIT
jgi:enoyl-[acyl-carrier protein] reductase I